MISVENVSKRYGDTLVVEDVSLTLPRGGLTALIGPNGAGKSTLLAMIARLVAPANGRILVDALDVATAPNDELARRLAILRQDNHIAMRLTVRDLVSFGRYPHSKGRLTADDRAAINRFLAYLDLTDLADRFLDEVSGGQRQRAFVAMVLAQDTAYMLFDEPLNNLDMRHAVAMMNLLRAAADDFGKTAVVVLHDINAAARYADHIVALRDGRLFCQGGPEAIIQPDVLQAIFDCPFRVLDDNGRRLASCYE